MTINLEIKKRFKVVLPTEWSNRQKGKFWEEISAPLFSRHRWKVIQDIEFEGMQTDIYVKHLDTNEKGLIECKFLQESIDAPTIYKLMGQADSEEVQYAYLLSTSELNPKARGIVEKYHNKQYKLVIWSSDQLAQVFMEIYNFKLPEINHKCIGRVENITLLLTHEKDFFWIAEEIGENGYPSRAIIFTITRNPFSSEEWKRYFSNHKLSWESLEINLFDQTVIENKGKLTKQPILDIEKVTVSKINQADSFDDYHRPCRPQDFFGRLEPQNEFWNFVKNVRDGKTDLRVVCFPGSTGVGKSSLVLKLASDCCQKQEYKDNFYIYHVDVTGVNPEKVTLFVVAVIRKALQEAIDSGFVDIPNHQVFIESTEPPFFSSKSIQAVIENLKNNSKIIVIFFDQFEEILANNSLLYLYELFKIAAYEVDSLKENIVLGFCWRTDVNPPATHQGYYTWHKLETVRRDIYFSGFYKKDSLNLLDGFEDYLTQTGKLLQPSIKKWLLDNCQNQPWLLKKICGDIYNQNLKQSDLTSEQKKVITKFDIQKIFDKDIRRYSITPDHDNCLKYIAKCSPVPRMDVCSKFNTDVINNLLDSKLVIETGQNYKIYWDIFREYLLDGKLPEIIISYRPRTQISTVLKIFRLLNQYKTISTLASKLEYKESTVKNAIEDLQKFFQVKKDNKTEKLIAPERFLKLEDEEIAEKLGEQIEAHIVIKEIYGHLNPGEWMWHEEFQNLLKKLFSDEETLRPDTPKDYTSRMLSWFCFAGLLEIREDWLIARPTHPKQGKQKGKLSKCQFNKRRIPKSKVTPGQLSLLDLLES